MADKKLTLGLSVDMKEFDAAIKKMQQDISKLQSPAAQIVTPQQAAYQKAGGAAPGISPGVQSFREHTQQSNQLGQIFRQKEQMSRVQIEAYNKEAIIKAGIAKSEKEITTQKEAQLKLDQQRRRLPTGSAIPNNNGMLGGPIQHGPWQQEQTPTGRGGIGVGGYAKYAAGALGTLGMAANYMGSRPIDIAKMQASAISMTTGRQLGEARTGEYTYEGMYGNDRKKAQEQAASSNKWKTAGDVVIAGAAVAALVGSAYATGGASLLLGGAGLAGLKSSFMDKGMADPSKYAAFREQREATDFTTMLAAQHEMGPYRKDAIERLKATGARDLGMERTLGLKDAGYYGEGGYLKSQTDLGFTDEMVTKASQGIIGAGGSTAMGLQSGISLQAQRGLNLTNADQLLGQLSGTQSIPETSKKALIDIFARGFDTSNSGKYAEENRKYMEAVTQQIYKGGTTSIDAADKIAEMIRSTVTGAPTTRNLEAGKTAFEAFQTASTATSGYLGGINVASAMQDENLKQIKDPAELQALLKLKPNEIDETDVDFVESAKKIGLTGPELAKKLRNRQVENIKKAVGGRTGMAERGMIGTLIPGLGAAEQKAFANLINQEPSPERDAQLEKLRAEAGTKMESKTTGNAGDAMIQASAKNAQISLETLSASINKFATDAMTAANKLVVEAHGGRAAETAKRENEEAPSYPSGRHVKHVEAGYGSKPPQPQGN